MNTLGTNTGSRRFTAICSFLLAALIVPLLPGPRDHAMAAQSLIDLVDQQFTGDLPEITQRRAIRVLVNYSRTNYFFYKGKGRGFEHELAKEYEKHLNKGVKREKDWTRVVFIPMRFDKLIESLNEGRGDIAAAGLTVTPQREEKVAFTTPYITDISEVVVLHKSVPAPKNLEALAGLEFFVRPGSSYVTHLNALAKSKKSTRKKPFAVHMADRYLVTEDILEMVNAGIMKATVADRHIADVWAEVLPNIVVRDDLKIHSGGSIAWAVRKNNPELLASLNAFMAKHKQGTLLGNIFFKRYYGNTTWVNNPSAGKDMGKLQSKFALFRKYGKRYGFDPFILAALAYQESRLDQQKKNPSGAMGIMQVLPSTAADRNINIKNIDKLENNIHAGTKYLNFIRNRYFSSPAIAPPDRVFFSLAAYNAGPAKINAIRGKTREQGLDPDRWFSNTEVVAARVIGRETVTYVASVTKYYLAYRLQYEMQSKRLKAKDSLEEKKK